MSSSGKPTRSVGGFPSGGSLICDGDGCNCYVKLAVIESTHFIMESGTAGRCYNDCSQSTTRPFSCGHLPAMQARVKSLIHRDGNPLQPMGYSGMERSLHVINKGPDAPLTAVCTACNRHFIVRHESSEDPLHRMTREFNDHDCK